MYESFYNLRGKPFQLNPDPAFFFASRGHRRAMAYLEYGLHQNEGFIVVTGEIGAGKTTLLRSLMEHLDESKVVAANLVSTQVDQNDILRMVASAFGVPSRGLDKAGLLLALETFFVTLAAEGRRALLIVDEAQNLSPLAVEELRMLSNFQLEDHALLQSFLVGQPEFRDIMQGTQMQQLRQRVIASYHLGPMDSEETRAYIEHRLEHVGWQGDPAIDDDAYTVIYGHSGGIPRRINTVCDRLMLAAYIGEKHRITAADAQEVVAELSEEFKPRPGSNAVNGKSTDKLASLPDVDGSRLVAPGELADKASALAANYETRRIEARLAGIESSVAAVHDVLARLLDAVRRDPPPPRYAALSTGPLREPSADENVQMTHATITNAFTIDVEDYFQVSAMEPHFSRDQWDTVPCRVERNVERILSLLDSHKAQGTFFTLGWIAERYPAMIRSIADAGHEVASHGYNHVRASAQTAESFLQDISRTRALLEDVCGTLVTGYRAPSFSIGAGNLWAHDCIAQAGYRYSSSVYPVKHDHYGMPDSPRFPYRLDNGLVEVPVTTMNWLGRNWPAGGGGYFRLLPYGVSRWQIARVNRHDNRPAIFYFHPWEVDPAQPRVPGVSARTRFRHYVNLHRTEPRLNRLLADFSWGRMDRVFAPETVA